MTYGCQRALTAKLTNKIRTSQNKMERSMLNVTWKDKLTLQEMKTKTKIADIISTTRFLKWSWTGHIIRSDNNSAKDITEWIPLGNKRSRGRQRKRWIDEIKSVAGSTWSRKARDREEWKRMGETFVRKDEHLD